MATSAEERRSALLARVTEMDAGSADADNDHEDVDDQDSSGSGGEAEQEAEGEGDAPEKPVAERPRAADGKFVPGKKGPPKVEPTVQKVGQEPPPKTDAASQVAAPIPEDPNQWPEHQIPHSRWKPVLQERNALRDERARWQQELQAHKDEIQRLRSWQPQQTQPQREDAPYDPLGLLGNGQDSQAAGALPPEVQQRLAKLDHLERQVQGLTTAQAVEGLKRDMNAVIAKYPETVTFDDLRDALRLNPKADLEDLAEALHVRVLNWQNKGRAAAAAAAPAQRPAPPPVAPRPQNRGSGSSSAASEVRSASQDKTSRIAAITERLKSWGS
jgi:hypothetical protein